MRQQNPKSFSRLRNFLVSCSLIASASFAQAAKESSDACAESVVGGEFVAQLKTGTLTTAKATLASRLAKIGFQIVEEIGENSGRLHLRFFAPVLVESSCQQRAAGIAALSSLTDFRYVEANARYKALNTTPTDSLLASQWGLLNVGQRAGTLNPGTFGADLDAVRAWDLGTGSRNIVVALLDTGTDLSHPDLQGNLWSMPGQSDVHGFNAITGSLDPGDDNSHGTHLAGIVGARGNNRFGVSGVNWESSLMSVKFLDKDATGNLVDALRAIDWAVDHSARVLLMSWGSTLYSQAMYDSIARAGDLGVLVISAAGNNAKDMDSTTESNKIYPAAYLLNNLVSVASSSNKDEISATSNFGVESVHILAPGESILSTVPGGAFDFKSGTSMSAAFVAGASALLLAKDPSLSPQLLKRRLSRTAEKSQPLLRKIQSSGRLNLYHLITDTLAPGFQPIPYEDWLNEDRVIETDHPYANNTNVSWEITKNGAKYIRLHLESFRSEEGYDSLTITNRAGTVLQKLEGNMSPGFFSMDFESDYLKLTFITDDSVTEAGFKINKVQWVPAQTQKSRARN